MHYVLCPVLYALCPISSVLCSKNYFQCPMSYVLCYISCVLCHTFYVICPMQNVLCPMSNVLCHLFCELCCVSYAQNDPFDPPRTPWGLGQWGGDPPKMCIRANSPYQCLYNLPRSSKYLKVLKMAILTPPQDPQRGWVREGDPRGTPPPPQWV